MEIELWQGSTEILPPNTDIIYKSGLLGYIVRSAYLGMSVSLTRCPLLCLHVCLCICQSAWLSKRSSFCLHVCLGVHLSACLPTSRSLHLLICWLTCMLMPASCKTQPDLTSSPADILLMCQLRTVHLPWSPAHSLQTFTQPRSTSHKPCCYTTAASLQSPMLYLACDGTGTVHSIPLTVLPLAVA